MATGFTTLNLDISRNIQASHLEATLVEKEEKPIVLIKDWKYYTGMTCMVLSLLLPLLGFVIPFIGLPVGVSAVLVGLLTVGGPEIMVILAVVFLGKQTFNYYKQKFFALFKRTGPIKPVSSTRYYIGLVILFGSPTILYLNAYAPHLLPANDTYRYYLLIGADLAFVLSFFILGGNFWEKFKGLFHP